MVKLRFYLTLKSNDVFETLVCRKWKSFRSFYYIIQDDVRRLKFKIIFSLFEEKFRSLKKSSSKKTKFCVGLLLETYLLDTLLGNYIKTRKP